MLSRKNVDATRGAVLPLIITYSVPLIIGNLIQNVFNMIDIAVLGNMADTGAVASVGATSTIISLIVNAIVNLSSGTKILLARQIGMKDSRQIRRTVDSSIVTALTLGCVVAFLGYLLAPLFLTITRCPADCFEGASLYLRIYVLSAPAIFVYNFGSSVIMTSGDTKRPLYYILASGLLNVILNIVLCVILPQKVIAVAVATVASQVLGAVLVMIRLCRMNDDMRVDLKRLKPSFESFVKIIRYGLPVAIYQAFYPLANLQIQSNINDYGLAAIAGNSAAVTIEGMIASFHSGFCTTVLTFMGQNIGAEKPDRVKKVFYTCLWIAPLICGSIGILVFLSGRFWLSLILGSDLIAIGYGLRRLLFVGGFYFVASFGGVFGYSIQAFGYTIFNALNSAICTLLFRVFWMNVIYPEFKTFDCIMLCFTVSWTLGCIFNIIAYSIIKMRYNKGKYKMI